MKFRTIAFIVCVGVLGLLAAPQMTRAEGNDHSPPNATPFVEVPATVETLKLVRNGGFVLYLRHGFTDNTKPDRASGIDLNDCSTQRPLTPQGLKLAARVGASVRKARIPIGEIHVSPLCRAKDTLAAAFPGLPHTIDVKLIYTANLTDAQKAPIISNTRRLLSVPVPVGSNRLLIAHAPNLMDLIGYFPKETTLVIFRPRVDEEGFDYIGSIRPELWDALLHQDSR
jgi:phosphohistidine phosphatase SixA